MGKHGETERDEEEDTDGEGLAAECVLKTIDAVLGGRTSVEGLEVEEETGEADSIAVKTALNIASEVLETLGNLDCLLLICRVGNVGVLGVKVLEVSVAVPEVVVGNSAVVGSKGEGNDGCVS